MRKLLAFNRMVGANPHERVFIDSTLLLRIFTQGKLNEALAKSEGIVYNFIKKAVEIFSLAHKFEKIRNQSFFLPIYLYINIMSFLVINIQRKWRGLSTKKIFYKMMIRNIWKEKFAQFYLELKFGKTNSDFEPSSIIPKKHFTQKR